MGITRYESLRIMGLEEGCTTKEIRDRFKKLALKWHPDKNIHNADEAQKKFQGISAAYTKLVSTEEPDDEIPTDALREMFAEIWQAHNRGRRQFAGDPHLFCDCEDCQADWEDISLEDFLGSDSDPDEDLYYNDTLYADDLLKEFADRLYRNFNSPGRAAKKAKSSWTGFGYREKVSAEEASRNAEELVMAEEEEKRQAEKKKQRNKKKKESKKRRKAKQREDEDSVGDKEENAEEECNEKDEEEEEEEEKEAENQEESGEDGVKREEKLCESVEQPELKPVLKEERRDSEKEEEQQPQQRQQQQQHDRVESRKPAVVAHVQEGGEREEEEEEEEEDTVLSEDELDFSSAFVKQAKASAAARVKSKETTSSEKVEPQKKSKGYKSNPRPDSGQHTSQPTAKMKTKQNNKSGTVNKGPSRSKEASVNGSSPVISAANGYIPPSGEEEDDLSPTDMSEAKLFEANIPESRQLAGEGNRAAKDGEFKEAVHKYSEAIKLYRFDHRYFGNRSFCYDYLHQYSKALADANSALKIDILWPKGFYRRGRALAGLKRYEAAVLAFSHALKLDPQYADAREQLGTVQLEHLQSMGFSPKDSKAALDEHGSVAAAVEAMVYKTAGGSRRKQRPPPTIPAADTYTPTYNHSGFEIPPRMLPQTAPPQKCALWVGNINSKSLSQQMLAKLFQRHGPVASVRMLYERRCAFVNYVRPESTATALNKLQGYEIAGCSLLLRYPENTGNPLPPPAQKSKKAGPVNGDECYFWRTTGCAFGDQCRYLHLPESAGVDAGSEYADDPSQ